MSVNLSIKDLPDDLAERLRERAQRNHRSLQGELMAIVEAAVGPARRMSAADIYARAKAAGLSAIDEFIEIVRAMRDAR